MLGEYVIAVYSLESLTGVDMFSNLYGSWDDEIELEEQATIPKGDWPFNERWAQQCMEKQRE